MSATVKPGYKQTEVGVIPENWEVKTLGSVLSKGRLGGNYANQDAEAELPLMKMGNLARGYFDLSKVQFITPGLRPELPHRLVYGDVLFNTRNTLDLVGKVAIWRDELPVAYYNSNLMRLEFHPEQVCSNEYANYALNTEGAVSRLRALATGTTSVAAIYTRDLMKLQVLVPPLPEQRAIAEALSDVDGLLGGLDRLIAKKRDLKQAAMQQLLTGQTRLPGFQGEWEVKRLGEVLKVRHGKSQHGIAAPDGKYPILASGGEIGRTNAFIYDQPSVLIGRKGTIDAPQYVDTPFWTVDTLFFTEISSEADAKFVFYKFTMIRWRSYNEASGVPSLNAKTIENIEVTMPPQPEQTAIAEVLSEMDGELAVLEQRREKTRALKQAMMQELLTGRTRLV
jgi:type I restriction enzyme, S subunit